MSITSALIGLTMIVDPSGNLLRLNQASLLPTPVSSYLLPGLTIIILYGLVPLLLASVLPNQKLIFAYSFIALLWIIFEVLFWRLADWPHAVVAMFHVLILVRLVLLRSNPAPDIQRSH